MGTNKLKLEFSVISGWGQIEDPLHGEDEAWEKFLKENGYYSHADRIGEDAISWTTEPYSVDDRCKVKPKYPHLVVIGNADRIETVFCVDFLSAVELLARYAPLVTASLVSGVIEDCKYRLDVERETSEREARQKNYEMKIMKGLGVG